MPTKVRTSENGVYGLPGVLHHGRAIMIIIWSKNWAFINGVPRRFGVELESRVRKRFRTPRNGVYARRAICAKGEKKIVDLC